MTKTKSKMKSYSNLKTLYIMKTKQFVGLTFAVAVSFLGNQMFAQENEVDSTSKSQITFAYPLGTNGVEAISQSNNFSVNVLYGINGGLTGIEFGGGMNYNKGDVSGCQLAGVVNINTEQTNGAMVAGDVNISLGQTSGAMISGLYNLTTEDSRGVQISTVNNATADYKGFQMGVFNYAKRLDGVQLGVVNVVGDGDEAIPIGLINVVRNGHYELEVMSGDALRTNLNYKMGVEQFYTIFKIGFSTYKGNPVYSTGIGFGSIVTLAEKHKLSMDLSTNQIIYDHDWEPEGSNYLTKFDLNYKLSLGEHVSLLAGPSFNLYVSEISVDDQFGTLRIPYNAHTVVYEDNQKWMWVGFNAGLAYRF